MLKYMVFVITFTLFRCEERTDVSHHECKRECKGYHMDCYYNISIEWVYTMDPNCGDCSTEATEDCFNKQCIVADGKRRLANVFNRKLPGPSIEVCEGDTVYVNYKNILGEICTTLHFHGITMRDSPFMDGTPMVTQCPILPGASFLYVFKALDPGTHFYHAHMGFQRATGAVAPFIVHSAKCDNPHRLLYDYDLAEHVITLMDWSLRLPLEDFNAMYQLHSPEPPSISAILVNGFGATPGNQVPLPTFIVKKGSNYRFRVIHAGSFNCPIKMFIEKHNISVISMDGADITPITVKTFFVTNGERLDFVLNANQTEDYYWMKFVGLMDCNKTESMALLKYSGIRSAPPQKQCVHLSLPNDTSINCISPDQKNCIGFGKINATDELDPVLKDCPDYKYHIILSMYNISRNEDKIIYAPAINNITFENPTKNLFQGMIDGEKICNRENRKKCDGNSSICSCVHYLEIPENKSVELIMINKGHKGIVHPMHLHGYSFRVVAQEHTDIPITIDLIKALDEEQKIKRNLDSPPLKDTVVVPNGGYAIIRFFTDNPGFWMLDSNVEFNRELGMAMIFKIGKPPCLPTNFPQCGEYSGTTESLIK